MSFSGDEEKLIDSVVSVLDSGREKFTFQEVQLQSEIRYKDRGNERVMVCKNIYFHLYGRNIP